MEAGTIVAITFGGVGALSTFAGGVWWASALFSRVKQIAELLEMYHHEHVAEVLVQTERSKRHSDAIDTHERRITTLEVIQGIHAVPAKG